MKKILLSMLAITMAAFTFTSCEDVPEPYEIPGGGNNGGGDIITEEPSGDGTSANPFNAAAITNVVSAMEVDVESTEDYYIKGVVVSIKENFTTQFGNATFNIADSETGKTQFCIFRTLYFDNKKYTSGDVLNVGDEVVVCGKVVNYKGNNSNTTPETAANKAYLVSVNGKTSSEGGGGDEQPTDGTYINETFASSFGSFTVNTVKGTPWVIDSYGYAKGTGFKAAGEPATPSASYIVSKAVSMSSAKEAKVSFDYILRYVTTTSGDAIDGIENKVLVTANYTGDPTTTQWTDITGKLTEVRDWKTWTKFTADVPAEIKGKNNVVFALYYACEESSGTWEVKNFTVKEGEEEGGDTPGGEVTENSITVAAVSFGLENGTEMGTKTLADGTVLTFDGGGNTNVPKYYKSGTNIRMYPKNIVKITSTKKISSVIFNCDKLADGTIYNASGDISATPGSVDTNNTIITINSINANETIITNVSSTTGAPSQMRIVSLTINYAE